MNENNPQEGFVIKTSKFKLRFNEDKSKVFLTVFDTGRLVTFDEAIDFLKTKGIVDFDKQKVKEYFTTNMLNEELLLAEGREVIHGLDSRLHVLVELEPKILPEINDDGTVDFKKIQSFPMVDKSEAVAEILPPTKGKNGLDVFGNIIEAHQGEVVEPTIGNNLTRDPNNEELVVSLKAGHIQFNENDVLEIQDVLIVDGDVDYGVGNIEFKGTVVIKGDVKSGFTIKADENIQIEGTVEDAHIICGKSVFIKGGFIGKGKGLVESVEDVTVHHVDHQKILSEKNIIIGEEAVNSDLQADNDIKVLGKKGTIMGGKAYAKNRIITKFAGNEQGIPTALSAGITKEIFEKIRNLRETIEKNEENMKKIKQNSYELYRLKLDDKLPPEKEKLLNYLRKAQSALPKQIEQDKMTLEELEKQKIKYKYSHIEISDVCYPKVKVLMGEDCFEVRDPYRNALFRMEKGMVSLFIKGKRIKLY